jgi:Transcriptional regulator
MDLTSLRLFVRAAESGSLSEAARISNLALAAASRRIALLEHRYRVVLFHRSRRGVALTPAGRAFLDNARMMLSHAQAMQVDMADFAGGRRGRVRLHANPSAVSQTLPTDLAAYAKQRPDVRIDLEEHLSADIVERVTGDQADIGIVLDGTPVAHLKTFPYRRDRYALVAPKGLLAGRTQVSFGEFYDHDFIGLSGQTILTRILSNQATRADRHLRLRMLVFSFHGICQMVEVGFGLGVLPETSARDFAKTMAIDVAMLSDPWAERQMLICLSPAAQSDPLAQGLAQYLSEARSFSS